MTLPRLALLTLLALTALPASAGAAPTLGETVTLAHVKGEVSVRVPGAAKPVPLAGARDVPVGTVVDTTNGAVNLTSVRDAGGALQTGLFAGGQFSIAQERETDWMTELVLRGGDFSICKRARAAGRKRTNPWARRLWGEDQKGRFRTRGRHAVAVVRGTGWWTEDHCEGTIVRVSEGAVDVVDLLRGTSVRVLAGDAVLVRAPRDR